MEYKWSICNGSGELELLGWFTVVLIGDELSCDYWNWCGSKEPLVVLILTIYMLYKVCIYIVVYGLISQLAIGVITIVIRVIDCVYRICNQINYQLSREIREKERPYEFAIFVSWIWVWIWMCANSVTVQKRSEPASGAASASVVPLLYDWLINWLTDLLFFFFSITVTVTVAPP